MSFELPADWPDVHPRVAAPTAHPFGGMYPQYYPADLELSFQAIRERIDEWDYDEDPHGYCHDRPLLAALLREISRTHGNKPTTVDDVIALVSEHPAGVGLNAAIEELGRRSATLHPLPAISESIMTTLKDGRVELTNDRLLRLTGEQ